MKNLDKVDKRVEKTRSAIILAFKEMIIEKDFNQLTVKELAQRANINRKTFYLHYQSLDEILFDLTLEVSDLLFESLNEKGFFNPDCYDINILVNTIDETINANYDLTKRIVSANSYHFFARNVKDIVKESFINKLKRKVNMDEYLMNMVGEFIASGLAKMLKEWFIKPSKLSSKELSMVVSSFIYGGLKAVMDLNKNNSFKN
ncbi:MAG: TetR family transcriptional regulator [Erysipelotrichaceae bacterium]|nr:TetR family transcriptional regulator [Erysipelotrichaceae bacterium]